MNVIVDEHENYLPREVPFDHVHSVLNPHLQNRPYLNILKLHYNCTICLCLDIGTKPPKTYHANKAC